MAPPRPRPRPDAAVKMTFVLFLSSGLMFSTTTGLNTWGQSNILNYTLVLVGKGLASPLQLPAFDPWVFLLKYKILLVSHTDWENLNRLTVQLKEEPLISFMANGVAQPSRNHIYHLDTQSNPPIPLPYTTQIYHQSWGKKRIPIARDIGGLKKASV